MFSDIHELKSCQTGGNDISIDPTDNILISEGDSGLEKGQIECNDNDEVIILAEEVENKKEIDKINSYNDLDKKMRESHIRTRNSLDIIRQIKLETENSFWFLYTEF